VNHVEAKSEVDHGSDRQQLSWSLSDFGQLEEGALRQPPTTPSGQQAETGTDDDACPDSPGLCSGVG